MYIFIVYFAKYIPATSAYGVYISQLIFYTWACVVFYHDFLDRGLLLHTKGATSGNQNCIPVQDHQSSPRVLVGFMSNYMSSRV